MNADLLARYHTRVPRYTSYPTAPHFTQDVGSDTYTEWLRALPPSDVLSLYLHVPFCAELCLYCGCHTTVARRYPPIAAYAELLKKEIALVVRHLGEGRPVAHIHWGGGTPTILSPQHHLDLMEMVNSRFDLQETAEIAIEIDPRTLSRDHVDALSESGINRASLGVQDFDETVQRTINRIQTYERTAEVAAWLRDAGISSLNLDLMYGLPHQSVDSVVQSVTTALNLAPARIALFGYAHVPWMKRHQALLPEEYMPGASERLDQMQAAFDTIVSAGYEAIGLDHFAVPDDPLVVSQKAGRLSRNFQGYTTDAASTLIGFGTSSIGKLPQGYVQNASTTVAYRQAISTNRLATARGIKLTADDRLRGSIIERLMCDLTVDLAHIDPAHGDVPNDFLAELASIDLMAEDGVVMRDGLRISVPDQARPFLRNVCAVFDSHLSPDGTRYSRAL